MAFTAHPGAAFNVEGSFNNFFATQLTAQGLPGWMPSAVVNYDYPNRPLTYPSWSVTHLGALPVEVAQGRHLDEGWRGARQNGLVEVNCWESEQRASGQAYLHIRQMRDMAARVFATGAAIAILDIYGSTANPTGNGTIIRAMPVEDGVMPTDPNPDVIRRRLLVRYNWLERATGG